MFNTFWMKRYIYRLPLGIPFVSRDLLAFGKRSLVDFVTHTMVKEGSLLRLARGVFCRKEDGSPKPDYTQVAEAKAKAFGKTIAIHKSEALRTLKIRDTSTTDLVFAVNGRTSSFNSIHGRIHFKTAVPVQVQAGNTKAGLMIRALAGIGKRNCTLTDVQKGRDNFSSDGYKASIKKEYPKFMPGWLSDLLVHFRRKSDKDELNSLPVLPCFISWLNKQKEVVPDDDFDEFEEYGSEEFIKKYGSIKRPSNQYQSNEHENNEHENS